MSVAPLVGCSRGLICMRPDLWLPLHVCCEQTGLVSVSSRGPKVA